MWKTVRARAGKWLTTKIQCLSNPGGSCAYEFTVVIIAYTRPVRPRTDLIPAQGEELGIPSWHSLGPRTLTKGGDRGMKQ